jgi:lipopolysaccharide/colanic/teichoic acid biosynthesis glycosyltransferase
MELQLSETTAALPCTNGHSGPLTPAAIAALIHRRRVYLRARRACDIFNALWLLVLLSPVFALAALAVWLQDRGSVFYRQERLTGGIGGPRFFRICKFRTMVKNADKLGGKITGLRDPRITPVGRLLRALKIDEMPQLINILRGEMSFVGPRPQTLGFVATFQDHYNAIHSVIPAGLTDLASLKYADEGRLLSQADDPEQYYVEQIMPRKMECHLEYIRRMSLGLDALILIATVLHVFVHKPALQMLRIAAREQA